MTANLPELAAPSNPLPPGQDFYELRREGIGYIAKLGSENWTDYNTHDPGITILEAVSYAMTELAWRTDLPIADILTSRTPAAPSGDPYPDQAFFSARSILTVNPTTSDDFRRLLIDLEAIRNAWVRCRSCACDVVVYAWCEHDQLTLSYDRSEPTDPQTEVTKVEPRGLYDVALEFEGDDDLGNLNDRKLITNLSIFDEHGRPHPVTLEVRFPPWSLADRSVRAAFVTGSVKATEVSAGPALTKATAAAVDDLTLRRNWQRVFYLTFDAELESNAHVLLEDASLRLFGDRYARDNATVDLIVDVLKDLSAAGVVPRYRAKLAVADRAIEHAKETLAAHRNLDEDYCHVRGIDVMDIAVCADVEVRPDADIELVQASFWFEIEQYLNPPIRFHFLEERLELGVRVETIFNGPELSSGFLDEDELDGAALRNAIRVSDIIDRLMELKLPGVIAVNGLRLTAYDAEGATVPGIADPTWDSTGAAHFDPTRVSASWLLLVPGGHQPQLYQHLSRFRFTSAGLPLSPDLGEVADTLIQLRGAAARPKLRDQHTDLPVPTGVTRDMDAYFPVQHSFPLVYGIGPAGLPSTATPLRRAQAKQLKAYLLVFEQLLRNAYAQVAHTADLFSLAHQDSTYFTEAFSDGDITGYSELVSGLSASSLAGLVESEPEFAERRNRFLDHLLARFGEQFGEYTMLLTGLEGDRAAKQDLIADKVAFLRAYPELSHDRGKAFNRTVAPCWPSNVSGLKHRVSLLLGYPDHSLVWRAHGSTVAPGYIQSLAVRDRTGAELLAFRPPDEVTAALETLIAVLALPANTTWELVDRRGALMLKVRQPEDDRPTETALASDADAVAFTDVLGLALRSILAQLVVADRYVLLPNGAGVGPGLEVLDADDNVIGERTATFDTQLAAESFRQGMLTWSANERALVVEHLLLRPKFPGDALYPACSDGGCTTCGDEDPYSFCLTFVMPGWTAPFNTNMQLRDFADRTIQQETPSHLVVKTCWVGNDGFVADPCDPVIDVLAAILEEHTGKADCACAAEILAAYREAFENWYAERTLEHHQREAVVAALTAALASVDLTSVGCAADIDAALRSKLDVAAVEYFTEIALRGRQFERFETAWCAWLRADSLIDWTEERLAETVTEVLRDYLTAPGDVAADEVCRCGADILAAFGSSFATWRDTNIRAGSVLDKFTVFDPDPIILCPKLTFKAAATEALRDLLKNRYAKYADVSYRLRLLVDALAELHSTYPSGTLHDCAEGNGRNPIRLGSTALGSNVQ